MKDAKLEILKKKIVQLDWLIKISEKERHSEKYAAFVEEKAILCRKVQARESLLAKLNDFVMSRIVVSRYIDDCIQPRDLHCEYLRVAGKDTINLGGFTRYITENYAIPVLLKIIHGKDREVFAGCRMVEKP